MKRAFTLAEVLITFGIIGIVAAITIPTLLSKYEKVVIENRLKSSYSIMANAIRLSEVDNGIGFNPTQKLTSVGFSKENAKSIFEEYFAPYIKINFRYSDDQCVEFSKAYSIAEDSSMYVDYNGACYSLMNGTALIFFAGRNATDDFSLPMTFIINPDKKRRIEGKDQFSFRIIRKNGSLYLGTIIGERLPTLSDSSLVEYCGSTSDRINILGGSWGRSAFCAELLMRNSWKIPDNYPIKF